jgi:hypothetical protein
VFSLTGKVQMGRCPWRAILVDKRFNYEHILTITGNYFSAFSHAVLAEILRFRVIIKSFCE